MITLNDYLYDGDTVLKILHRYATDLREDARITRNQIDFVHSNFLVQLTELLEHTEFLASQAQRIRELYLLMADRYPFLAFTFKGRVKSLIRAEQKFNGNLVSYIYKYHQAHGCFPQLPQVKSQVTRFRDLIAYRIVISLPKCHVRPGEDRKERELHYLYEIADMLPEFLEERGFTVEICNDQATLSSRLSPDSRAYYKDYIEHPNSYGYQSLHITVFDNVACSYFELQLRTKEMDDYAEIGPANHLGYEERQKKERLRRERVPEGECVWFDEAYERGRRLQELELRDLDVNLFGAADNHLINDGCGLYRGRLILPLEHLSRFQND